MKIFQKYMLICLTLTISMLVGCPHDKDSMINIETQDGLQNLLTKSQGPIVISFHMKNCGWCKQMESIINDLAADSRFNNICFYRVDGRGLKAAQDKQSIATPDLVKQITGQDLPGYPFLLFMDQGKYITKQVGGTTEEELTKKIEMTFSHVINHNPGDTSCGCGCNHN